MKRLLFSICICVGLAFAKVEVLQPGPDDCCDTTIVQGQPDDNYGEFNMSQFGYMTTDGVLMAMIRFDELDDPRFDGCEVDEATLALWPISGAGWGSPPLDCFVYPITSDWDQDTVTWNTMPGYSYSPAVLFTYTTDSGWLYIDITDIVEFWLEDDGLNFGVYIGPREYLHCGSTLRTGEYSDNPNQRPALQIVYSGATVVETSWGSIKPLK